MRVLGLMALKQTIPMLGHPSPPAIMDTLEREMSRTQNQETQHRPSIHVTTSSSPQEAVQAVEQRQVRRHSTGSSQVLTSASPLTREGTRGTLARPTDVTAYTTSDDNGQKFAAKYIRQQRIHDVIIPNADTTMAYIKSVNNRLADAEVRSDWRKTQSFFTPCTALIDIINEKDAWSES